MIEGPALIWQLESVLPLVDFVAVGSNDLFQFFYAVDREEDRLAERYDPLSVPFLKCLKYIRDQCQAHKVPLSICGEIAGRPLEVLALLGLGYDRLSMAYQSVVDIRLLIQKIPMAVLQEKVLHWLQSEQGSLREHLKAFAQENKLNI